jgi:hypothetical protein
MGFTITLPSLWLYYSHFPECKCKHDQIGKVTTFSSVKEIEVFNSSAFVFSSREEFWLNYVDVGAALQRNSCKIAIDDEDIATCKNKRRCEGYSGLIVAAFPFAQFVFSPLYSCPPGPSCYLYECQSANAVIVLDLEWNSRLHLLYSDGCMLQQIRTLGHAPTRQRSSVNIVASARLGIHVVFSGDNRACPGHFALSHGHRRFQRLCSPLLRVWYVPSYMLQKNYSGTQLQSKPLHASRLTAQPLRRMLRVP